MWQCWGTWECAAPGFFGSTSMWRITLHTFSHSNESLKRVLCVVHIDFNQRSSSIRNKKCPSGLGCWLEMNVENHCGRGHINWYITRIWQQMRPTAYMLDSWAAHLIKAARGGWGASELIQEEGNSSLKGSEHKNIWGAWLDKIRGPSSPSSCTHIASLSSQGSIHPIVAVKLEG